MAIASKARTPAKNDAKASTRTAAKKTAATKVVAGKASPAPGKAAAKSAAAKAAPTRAAAAKAVPAKKPAAAKVSAQPAAGAEKVKGPASYFPSIEKTYGKPVAHWFAIIDALGARKHMELVAELKSAHGLGHGHANALVAHRLAQVGKA